MNKRHSSRRLLWSCLALSCLAGSVDGAGSLTTVGEALKKPDVMDRLATQGGSELVGNTPEEFAQAIKSDLAKYAKLVKAANIQVQ